MNEMSSVSRRQFVVGASGLLWASAVPTAGHAAGPQQTPQLAVAGGEKAVTGTVVMERRWGEPERQQLESMLQQDSLFYWQGPQTNLLTERFREICPVPHVQT